jgi:hypothetical protein
VAELPQPDPNYDAAVAMLQDCGCDCKLSDRVTVTITTINGENVPGGIPVPVGPPPLNGELDLTPDASGFLDLYNAEVGNAFGPQDSVDALLEEISAGLDTLGGLIDILDGGLGLLGDIQMLFATPVPQDVLDGTAAGLTGGDTAESALGIDYGSYTLTPTAGGGGGGGGGTGVGTGGLSVGKCAAMSIGTEYEYCLPNSPPGGFPWTWVLAFAWANAQQPEPVAVCAWQPTDLPATISSDLGTQDSQSTGVAHFQFVFSRKLSPTEMLQLFITYAGGQQLIITLVFLPGTQVAQLLGPPSGPGHYDLQCGGSGGDGGGGGIGPA